MGEFFKFFRKFPIKAGAHHNGGAAPLFLLLGLEFERFFSALDMSLILKFVVIITMHLLVEFWHENFMVNLLIFSSLIK